MEITASEMMRNYVNSQKFSSTAEIMEAMKDMFRDALQQVMEGELEQQLGYEKSERTSEDGGHKQSKNYRNGYSKKSVVELSRKAHTQVAGKSCDIGSVGIDWSGWDGTRYAARRMNTASRPSHATRDAGAGFTVGGSRGRPRGRGAQFKPPIFADSKCPVSKAEADFQNWRYGGVCGCNRSRSNQKQGFSLVCVSTCTEADGRPILF